MYIVCVCLIYIYIYIHIYTYIYIYVSIHSSCYILTYIYIYICISKQKQNMCIYKLMYLIYPIGYDWTSFRSPIESGRDLRTTTYSFLKWCFVSRLCGCFKQRQKHKVSFKIQSYIDIHICMYLYIYRYM